MISLSKSSSSKTICSVTLQSCTFYSDNCNLKKDIKDTSIKLKKISKEIQIHIDKEHDNANNLRKSSLEYEEILQDMFTYKEKDLSISTVEKKKSLS